MPGFGRWWPWRRDQDLFIWRPHRKRHPRLLTLLPVLALCSGLQYPTDQLPTGSYPSRGAIVADVHQGTVPGEVTGTSVAPRSARPPARKKHAGVLRSSPIVSGRLARSHRFCRTRRGTATAHRSRLPTAACVRTRSGVRVHLKSAKHFRVKHAISPRGISRRNHAR